MHSEHDYTWRNTQSDGHRHLSGKHEHSPAWACELQNKVYRDRPRTDTLHLPLHNSPPSETARQRAQTAVIRWLVWGYSSLFISSQQLIKQSSDGYKLRSQHRVEWTWTELFVTEGNLVQHFFFPPTYSQFKLLRSGGWFKLRALINPSDSGKQVNNIRATIKDVENQMSSSLLLKCNFSSITGHKMWF